MTPDLQKLCFEVISVLVVLSTASFSEIVRVDRNVSYIKVVGLSGPSCPINCTCSPDLKGPVLQIDCRNRTQSNSSLITELDDLLTGSFLNLTELTIINAQLPIVPNSICGLKYLKKLTLNAVQLSSLPENCFTVMSELEDFTANYNEITAIKDRVFFGLKTLRILSLQFNKITEIGLNVFTEEAGLSSLRVIDLTRNKLSVLEPWPLIRGQFVHDSDISLNDNIIHAFSNKIGWNFRCGMPRVWVNLWLNSNKIQHITDILNGWNITNWLKIPCIVGPGTHNDFDMHVAHNPFACDCLDYEYYAIFRAFPHISFPYQIYCYGSSDLAGRQLMSVPLDQFVCVVPSPPCPQGCKCVKRPSDASYIVTCQHLQKLPSVLPDTSQPPPVKAKYVLKFSGSELHTIDNQIYFNNTRSVDVSSSSVAKITDDAWRALSHVSDVDLSSNRLTVLPTILQSENLTFMSLSIYDNPWRCECNDRWIRQWLLSLETRLKRPKSVLCSSPENLRGKSILSLNDEQFCYDPQRENTIMLIKVIVPAVAGSALLTLLILATLFRYRVKVFVHFKVHPFDLDECEGEDMTYDVFLSCAYQDRDIGRMLLNRLERRVDDVDCKLLPKEGYRVCYHERDFLPGELITENIQTAIERSKRVMCLVSRHFLRSGYCMMEFRSAWNHHTNLKKRRLVIIKWPDVEFSTQPPSETPDESATFLQDVRLFLSTHTYIDYSSTSWWQNLVYSLPVHGLRKTSAEHTMSCEDIDSVLLEARSTDNLLVV